MKYAKIFAVFIALHLLAWAAVHFYQKTNPNQVLVVVDTSFSMKPKFPMMREWIDSYESSNRYKNILIGTDKAMLGKLEELKSKDMIFRTSFGKLQQDNLKRHFSGVKATQKMLLSDGSVQPDGWETIEF